MLNADGGCNDWEYCPVVAEGHLVKMAAASRSEELTRFRQATAFSKKAMRCPSNDLPPHQTEGSSVAEKPGARRTSSLSG